MPKLKHNKAKTFYTNISNTILQNGKLTPNAIGVFSYMYSLPDNWELNEVAIVNHFEKVGRTVIHNAICELESMGYLIRLPKRRVSGKFCGKEWYLRDNLEDPWTEEIQEEINKMKKKTSNNTTKQENEKETKQQPAKKQEQPAKPVQEVAKEERAKEEIKQWVKTSFNHWVREYHLKNGKLSNIQLNRIALAIEQKHLASGFHELDNFIKEVLEGANDYPAGYLLKIVKNEDEVKR